jgi:hypothetical protein
VTVGRLHAWTRKKRRFSRKEEEENAAAMVPRRAVMMRHLSRATSDTNIIFAILLHRVNTVHTFESVRQMVSASQTHPRLKVFLVTSSKIVETNVDLGCHMSPTVLEST